jgi:hypothetical protein
VPFPPTEQSGLYQQQKTIATRDFLMFDTCVVFPSGVVSFLFQEAHETRNQLLFHRNRTTVGIRCQPSREPPKYHQDEILLRLDRTPDQVVGTVALAVMRILACILESPTPHLVWPCHAVPEIPIF